MNKVLLKDIIIPAGTIFTDAPRKTVRSPGFGMATIGLTDDTHGSITYDFGGGDDELLEEWFADAVKGEVR